MCRYVLVFLKSGQTLRIKVGSLGAASALLRSFKESICLDPSKTSPTFDVLFDTGACLCSLVIADISAIQIEEI